MTKLSGFGRAENGAFTAPEATWKAFLAVKSNENCKKFRYHPLRRKETLYFLFADVVATGVHAVTVDDFLAVDDAELRSNDDDDEEGDIDAEGVVDEDEITQRIRDECGSDAEEDDPESFAELVAHEKKAMEAANKAIFTTPVSRAISTTPGFEFESNASTASLGVSSSLQQTPRSSVSAPSSKRRAAASIDAASNKKPKMTVVRSVDSINATLLGLTDEMRADRKTEQATKSWQEQAVLLLKQKFKEETTIEERLHIYDIFGLESNARAFALMNEDEQRA